MNDLFVPRRPCPVNAGGEGGRLASCRLLALQPLQDRHRLLGAGLGHDLAGPVGDLGILRGDRLRGWFRQT